MNQSLVALQDAFQAAILTEDLKILPQLKAPPTGTVAQAFGVYEDAYGVRLHGFLTNAYPVLLKLVGEDAFADIAQSYIAHAPSHSRNARHYGSKLPEHLQSQSHFPTLWSEMAEFERALEDAFDAADQPAATLEDLSRAAAPGPEGLRFHIAASVRLLGFRHNVTAIWSALLAGEEEPEEEEFEVAKPVLVFRQHEQSRYRLLGAEEHMMLSLLQQGLSISQMVEMLAFQIGAEAATRESASCIRNWITCGMITDIEVKTT